MRLDKSNSDDRAPRKQLIVEAAIRCFIERGYNQTGVRDIASTAGVSLGNLYNYFKGKDAIIEEIASYEAVELEPFVTQLSAEGKRLDTLIAFIHSYFDYACAPENCLLGIEIIGEAVRNQQIATIFHANRKPIIEALQNLLHKGSSQGEFREILCYRETSNLILDAIEGRALRLNFAGVDKSAAAQNELVSFIVSAVCVMPTIVK